MCTIYHNPKCSKSRKALEILEGKNLVLEVREYLKTGISLDEVKQLEELLQEPISGFIRKKEELFKELGLEKANDNELAHALTQNPKLLERPIVIHNKRAVVARPPEELEKLFSNN